MLPENRINLLSNIINTNYENILISTLDVFKKIFSEVGIESIPNQTPQKLERIDSMGLINQAQILINQSIFTCHKQVRDML